MYTYQDLRAIDPKDEQRRMDFVRTAIQQHQNSELYETAKLADEYSRHKNRTILQFQKFLRDDLGRLIPDLYSPNYKLASNFFKRFVVQENQYLLGNGVTWKNEATKKKLGQDFDVRLQQAGRAALVGGVSFGFFNYDHLEVFPVYSANGSCFVPLHDEENSALRAGIQYWQIDSQKPLFAILYEAEGYTTYAWNRRTEGDAARQSEGEILQPQRPYIVKTRTIGTGEKFYDYRNYPTFPIVPLWGNPEHQSELTGIREQIDAYDLIKSGFANDLDNAQIYWILHNMGGMDDADVAKFLRQLKSLHAATVQDSNLSGSGHIVEPVEVHIPWESREKLLERLERDLYKDFMALDTQYLASGAMTATQIRAAYEPLNSKADQYEYCVLDFLHGVLAVAGIEDEPTFTRSAIVNVQEEVQTVIQAAEYLDDEYLTRKVLTFFGDGDQADEILRRKAADDIERLDEETASDKDGTIGFKTGAEGVTGNGAA